MATDKAFPREKGSDARIPLSHTVISSASEKSFSFAVKTVYACERKREACFSRALGDTVFHADGSAELVRKRIATKIPRLRSG